MLRFLHTHRKRPPEGGRERSRERVREGEKGVEREREGGRGVKREREGGREKDSKTLAAQSPKTN